MCLSFVVPNVVLGLTLALEKPCKLAGDIFILHLKRMWLVLN